MPGLRSSRRSPLRDLREALIRIGAGSGTLVAVWYGVDHASEPARCSLARGVRASEALRHCIARSTYSIAWHWALILAAGLAIGLAAGVSMALLVPTPRSA